MTRPDRTRLDDPTAENAVEQSTPGESGLGAGRDVDDERNRAREEDVVRRVPIERDSTPRRYDQPIQDDPVMPTDDSSLNTKI